MGKDAVVMAVPAAAFNKPQAVPVTPAEAFDRLIRHTKGQLAALEELRPFFQNLTRPPSL